jgi:F5/8 type C domain-containing protein
VKASSFWLRAAGVCVVYVALSIAYTWPLLPLSRLQLASDAGDPAFNTVLWWNATRLPFSGAWWNAPQYFPTENISAFTESLVGIGLVFNPAYWLSGNPVFAYNAALFLTWPLSAFATYLLVRFLTKRDDAAIMAGLAYGFSPYRTTEIAHIQSLSSYGLPLVLLGLHGFREEHRRRWLALFAAAWLMQSLANGHFMLFGAVLIVMWLVYFCSTRETWRTGLTLLGVWAAASLLLVPILLKYQSVHDRFGLQRTENEILAYSARPASWTEVSGDVWFWRSFLPDGKDDLFPGLTAAALVFVAALFWSTEPRTGSRLERFRVLRIGLAVVVVLSLAAIAASLVAGQWSITAGDTVLFRMTNLNRALALIVSCGVTLTLITPAARRALASRSPLVFYAAAVIVIALFCCGPVLRVGEEVILEPAPYRWLMSLPGFLELRSPARFWMLGVLCLSVAAGLSFDRLRPARRPTQMTMWSLIALAMLLDGWMPAMRMAAAPETRSAVEPRDRPQPILELPIGPDWDFAATFRAVTHGRRVVNGVSGYNPPYYVALVSGLERRDPAVLEALASLGSYDVVVDGNADRDGAIARYVSQAPGAARETSDGSRTLFRIPQGQVEPALGAAIPIVSGRAVRHDPDVRLAFDGRIDTGWGDFPQQPDQWLIADLGSVHELGGVTQAIGDYLLDFPQRLAIDVSTDGSNWQPVWDGRTAAATLLAYLREPRVGALRFSFDPKLGRYVRLRQLESFRSLWRVSELTVHAPPSR